MASPATAVTPAAFNLDVVPPVVASEFEVVERSDSFEVKADLADGENVRLGVTSDRVVHIVVEKRSEEDGDQPGSPREFCQRAVPLPASVDETKVTASFNQGELKMCLPKRTEQVAMQTTAIPSC
eukprot:scaffold586209_cov34-Prasinocladus_malaysianus.AAC.1